MMKIKLDNHTTKEELNNLNIFIDDEVTIGKDVEISSGAKLIGKCVIGDNCIIDVNSVIINSELKAYVRVISSFVEDSVVEVNTVIGPFASIKKNSVIGNNCRIGNFVEIKNSIVGNKCKIAHLAYVGDAELGENCNVGCGVVFCNYNGKIKQKSLIGDNVFIGSNVNIIAPIKIGDWAYIAAGSTINKDIECKQFSIARSCQINKDNFNNPYKK